MSLGLTFLSRPPVLYLALTTLLKFIPFLLTVAQTCFLLKPHILFINEVQFASFTIFFFLKTHFFHLILVVFKFVSASQ